MGLRIFSLSHAREKEEKIFLCLITELKFFFYSYHSNDDLVFGKKVDLTSNIFFFVSRSSQV